MNLSKIGFKRSKIVKICVNKMSKSPFFVKIRLKKNCPSHQIDV